MAKEKSLSDRSNPSSGTTVSVPRLQELQVPDRLRLIPLKDHVLFPGGVFPLSTSRSVWRAAAEAAWKDQRLLAVVAQKDPLQEDPAPQDLYEMGTACLILRPTDMPDGALSILLQGLVRIRIKKVQVTPEGFWEADVEVLPDQMPADLQALGELTTQVRHGAFDLMELSPQVPEEARGILEGLDMPGAMADFLASSLNIDTPDKQVILETTDLLVRLAKVRQNIANRLEMLELHQKIQTQVRSSLDKNQRVYFLQEQLKAIQKELGQEEGPAGEVSDLRQRIAKAQLPEKVQKEADRELRRLAMIPMASPEFGVIRSYLETLAELPWNLMTPDSGDLARARLILERDHYNLRKIKERLIEFLAVRKLNPSGRSPILCLVGPPGVGKTSLGRSVAEALGRKFVRMSLGGARDEADIRGHRRTYIGSMPGRIIQELRKAQSRNPVMMLDEIDKLGADFRGDPAAALLEVLDPEQNSTFEDHYLGVAFDLSQVIFMCTANQLEPIPPALRDRMEILEVSGYNQKDKLQIAQNFLLPRQLKDHGLTPRQCRISRGILEWLIDRYTRESGVRNLERTIAAVVRGVAARHAESLPPVPTTAEIKKLPTIKVEVADVAQFLGSPKFDNELALRKALPGVVTGLAYTAAGGEILFIEATQMPGKGQLQLTGQIGEVMKESAQAAYSLVKHSAVSLGLEPELFSRVDVHIHVPAGAVPKDGPSAGVAMYTALVSLLSDKPARPDVAMTGEITLRGAVLPIGGLKEKLVAAERAGITMVVLPQRNRPQFDEIRAELGEGLNIRFIENVGELLPLAFNAPAKAARLGKAARV